MWLPNQCVVEQVVVLKAPPEEVYAFINNPAEWPKWTILNKKTDPSVIHLYAGPMQGKGARMQWSGDKVGNGQLIITESTNPYSITYVQKEEGGEDTTRGEFVLQQVNRGTMVHWKQRTPLADNPLGRVQGAIRKYKKQNELQQSLQGLNNLISNNSKRRASK
ncbi:SRPBCC family protein [Pontibacter silvestris]|uniref:SRPBCC family protein n=2 Tax=Pontibacter silvestris TaxID=2305183 RepID=A0ABW4WXH8_9BACT|nr:SRPBCC family protein [Pontibacter silvestris]MCC9137392.1 SRPBCC family protein [Pontibacter silvestris]